jgi:hypothetical protein
VAGCNFSLGSISIDKREETVLDAYAVYTAGGNAVKDGKSRIMLSKTSADISH